MTPKRYNKIFPKNQSICGFFDNKCSFQNWSWNLFSTSGLSQIRKIRNASKLPSACVKDNFDKVYKHQSIMQLACIGYALDQF
jgi:hypothetical protein